jgi:hypothetical protein
VGTAAAHVSPPVPPSPPYRGWTAAAGSVGRSRARAVLHEINARWLSARPTNNLSAAGVLLHAFDGLEHPSLPWTVCPDGEPWLRYCAKFNNRLSASLVRRAHGAAWSGSGHGGFVVRPTTARVLCAFRSDGGTISNGRDPCCGTENLHHLPPALQRQHLRKLGSCWCTEPGPRFKCAHAADAFVDMMRGQNRRGHNEVVLDVDVLAERLPHSIEAFVAFRVRPPATPKPLHEQAIVHVHRAFVRNHSLEPDDVPLLVYDDERTPPFRMFHAPPRDPRDP